MKEKIRNLFDEMKVRSRYKSMSDIINMIEPIVNQEVEKRIAETVAGKFIAVEIEKRIKERMPSEEDVRNELCRHLYNWLENNAFKDGCNWICSRLTCSEIPNNSKTEGGGE